MPCYPILCQSRVTAEALRVWRDLLGGEDLCGKEQAPEPIVFDPTACPDEQGTIAYLTLVHRLESAAGLSNGMAGPTEIVVLVDSVRPMGVSAIAEASTWDHLIAMLILTFPEIRWVFGVIQGKTDLSDSHQENEAGFGDGGHVQGGLRFPIEDHNLLSLLTKPHRQTIYDPTGLREWVKRRTTETLNNFLKGDQFEAERTDRVGLPQRAQRAASIDEEPEYAFLHAYAAYRYGFLADVVTTWSLMEHLFGGESESHGFSLLLEDMRLQFPDKPAGFHLSKLRAFELHGKRTGRAAHCPLLDNDEDTSTWRFLITTGQMGKDRELVVENEDYLAAKILGRGAVLYKPVGGVMDLWAKAGLGEDLNHGSRCGNAPGFVWPPPFHEEALLGGHGAPGKLTLVAANLLRRAGDLRRSADTVAEFLRGAVLCTEATELLGGKTPTLTLSGLALKQEFEVRAECAFVGAGYHFDLERRLDELKQEVDSATERFHEDHRKRAGWDARASALNRLILIYREAGQIEEEQECLVALRKLNRKMRRPKRLNALNPFAWLVHGVLSYGEWLLASFPHIVLMTLFWIVLLAAVASEIGAAGFYDPIHATSKVFGWTFGGGAEAIEDSPGLVAETCTMILSWFGVTTGLFHLGVLVSYLYSLIARK